MESLFSHILVPLDFTEKNKPALEVALRLARDHGSHLTLLHVIETIQQAENEDIADFYQMLEAKARERMEALAVPLLTAGIAVQQEIILGNRGRDMVRYSMERDVDLVVLSSRKVNLDEPSQSWGSLSHQVSILCQCPVLLVK